MRIWVNRALLGTGWVALLAGIAGIALYFSGSQRRTVVLLASGASLLMVGTIVALVLFAIARGRRSMIAAAIAVAAALWTQVPIYVPDGHAATGPQLIVMQSNLLFGEADTGAVVDAVRAQRVDVLTVNELTPDDVAGSPRRVSAHCCHTTTWKIPRPVASAPASTAGTRCATPRTTTASCSTTSPRSWTIPIAAPSRSTPSTRCRRPWISADGSVN
nr:hypothetical protein [Nocardia cyriacigeorgica]